MANNAKKHHYVPRFYLKGFLSEEGGLYAYKKKFGSLRQYSPSQILYKENLHTIKIRDESTLMIEEFYSKIEGEFSRYRTVLQENIEHSDIIASLINDEGFIKIAKIIAAIQFWRTPCKKNLASEYAEKLLSLYDEADDEIKEFIWRDRKFVRFIGKRAKKDDSIKVAQFLLLPLLSFDLLNKKKKINLFVAPKGEVLFTSDRPVIYDTCEQLFSFDSFFFPFSKNILLLDSKKDIKQLSVNGLNALIAEKAAEIIVSGSREQLEVLKSNNRFKSLAPLAGTD